MGLSRDARCETYRVQAPCAQLGKVLHAAARVGGRMQQEPHREVEALVGSLGACRSSGALRAGLALFWPSCRQPQSPTGLVAAWDGASAGGLRSHIAGAEVRKGGWFC